MKNSPTVFFCRERLTTATSNAAYYSVLTMVLLSAVNPAIIDLAFLASFKYLAMGFATLVNCLFLLSSTRTLKYHLPYRIVYTFVLILIFSMVNTMDFVESGSRIVSIVIVFAFLISSDQFLDNSFEGFIKFGYFCSIIVIVASALCLLFFLNASINSGNFRGPFYNANFLGAVLTFLCIPALLFRILASRGRGKVLRLVVSIVLLSSAIGLLVLTRSRSAFLMFFVFLTIFYVLKHMSISRQIFRLTAAAVIVLIGLLGLMKEDQIDFVYSNYVVKYESASFVGETRSGMYETRLSAIGEKPMLGWGYGINPSKIDSGIKDYGHGSTEKGSSFLAIVEELGVIPGAIAIIAVLLGIAELVRRCCSMTCELERSRCAIFCGILMAGLIHAQFESWLFYFGSFISLYYWSIFVSKMSPSQAN